MSTNDTTVHPIVNVAGVNMQGEGARMQLSREGQRRVSAALQALYEAPELPLAVRSLIALAAHMERDLGAVAAADQLISIAAGATGAIERMGSMAEGRQSANIRVVKKAFGRFSGRVQKITAPRFGAAAPAGAFRAGTFNIPAVIR